MGPEIEEKGKSETMMDAPVNKANGTVDKVDENKPLKCVSNHEDYTFKMDASFVEEAEGHGGEDGIVDVVGNMHCDLDELVDEDEQETTECSSSFDNVSGVENNAALSDAEVVSDFCENASSELAFDGFGEVSRMRKKKVTPHWRTFIQPLMWRCKWIELQLKKLKSLERKYDSELAEYSRKEQIQVENMMMDSSTKSVPFYGGNQRDKILKRKKRKRVEDTMDVTGYMSRHNLFSYYEKGNVTGDGAPFDDQWSNLENNNYNPASGLHDEYLWPEFGDGEDSLEQMLRKIGTLQEQVNQLKTRLDKVMSEHPGKFTYADNSSLLVPCNALMSSDSRPNNGGDTMAAGSSYVASQLDGICHTEDDILIYDKRVKEEMNNFEEVKIQSTGMPRALNEQQQETTVSPVLEETDRPTDDQPPPKIRSISKLTAPRNKRKGRRRSSYGRRRQS